MPISTEQGLSHLVEEFRAQVAAHSVRNPGNLSFQEEEELVDATYGPALEALHKPPVAKSVADKIAALDLVLENNNLDALDEAQIRAVLAGLKEPAITWAVAGARCICIDEDWIGIEGGRPRGPSDGQECIIESVSTCGGAEWVKIRGYDDYFELCAFRSAGDRLAS